MDRTVLLEAMVLAWPWSWPGHGLGLEGHFVSICNVIWNSHYICINFCAVFDTLNSLTMTGGLNWMLSSIFSFSPAETYANGLWAKFLVLALKVLFSALRIQSLTAPLVMVMVIVQTSCNWLSQLSRVGFTKCHSIDSHFRRDLSSQSNDRYKTPFSLLNQSPDWYWQNYT